MRKTVDLTEDEIKLVTDFQKKNKLKSFSEAIRVMIQSGNECQCSTKNDADENFVLLADAIIKMDKKLDVVVGSIAPKHAGEI
jgi:hypothetical protein